MTTVKKGTEIGVITKTDLGSRGTNWFYVTGRVASNRMKGSHSESKISNMKVYRAFLKDGGKGFKSSPEDRIPADEWPADDCTIRVHNKTLKITIIMHDANNEEEDVIMGVNLHLTASVYSGEWNARTRRSAPKKAKTGRYFQGKAVYRGVRGGLFTESRGRRTYL